MENPIDTITHPWREPIDYIKLSFWIVIFAIVSFMVYDMLRILASWVKHNAPSA
jgi:hypothetical protein